MKQYQHDCEKCLFVWSYRNYDVYLCDDTVILRYGNEGAQYKSLLLPWLMATSDADFRVVARHLIRMRHISIVNNHKEK